MLDNNTPTNESNEIEEQFVLVASALYSHFPDLDLRFNLRCGTSKARCLIPHPKKALKLPLGSKDTDELVREAVWAIKVLIRRFDD
jgi:hypothetical protein